MSIPASTGHPSSVAAAGALAHPSRRRIAEVLRDAPDGLTVAEVAEAVDLHRNAARQHLRVLADAGIVAAHRDAPSGRGRPGLRHQLVDPEISRIAAHEELVGMLVRMLVETGIDGGAVERFGREHGRTLARPGGADALIAGFARLAFSPKEVGSAADRRAGRLELSLENCPFREAVGAPGGELVCTLHRGIAAGMAEAACPGARVTDFAPADPRSAGCRITFEGLVADPGGEAAAGPAGKVSPGRR